MREGGFKSDGIRFDSTVVFVEIRDLITVLLQMSGGQRMLDCVTTFMHQAHQHVVETAFRAERDFFLPRITASAFIHAGFK